MKLHWHVYMLIVFALINSRVNAEEFSFDVASYEKKNFTVGGYLDYAISYQQLNQSAVANILYYINESSPDALTQHAGIAELNADYKTEKWLGHLLLHADGYTNERLSESQSSFYEAFAEYQPATGVTLEAGKKALKWGKGYAWNPVGFIERPKDPNDPDLSREGYVIASADIIKSFTGELKTLAFTPVYLPVIEKVNQDFGTAENHNIAAKVYFLYKDTDIDIVYLNQGSRSLRYGFDFSKNLSPNFEVHGEWAYFDSVTIPLVSASGNISSQTESANRWLLGMRYLSENETTIIAEYYQNSSGYSASEMESFFTAVDNARNANNTSLLTSLVSIGEKTFLARNPGRDYLYLRLSIKEPFNLVYFVPALTTIYNLNDNSYSLAPELVYSGFQNLELRFRAMLLYGNNNSEFQEKYLQQRYEFGLRYYF